MPIERDPCHVLCLNIPAHFILMSPMQSNGKAAENSSSSKTPRVKDLNTNSTVQGAKHKLQEEKIFQTEAFKSLFTSHPSAKRAKDKNGHWITYNPYHYAG